MEQVTGALKDVNLGMSKKRAALKWKIPRSSLQHYIKTGSDGDCRPGPPSILTNTEESLWLNGLFSCADEESLLRRQTYWTVSSA